MAIRGSGRARGGRAVAGSPALAVKPTAYEPAEVGTNNAYLRNATGWSLLPGSPGSETASWNVWRTYTGGLIGVDGFADSTLPGETIVGYNSGSTNHVFSATFSASTNDHFSFVVAASSVTNCVWVETGVIDATGAIFITVNKKDSTGSIQLGGWNYNQVPELQRTSNDDSVNRLIRQGDRLTVQVLGQRVHVFINGKRITEHVGLDLDTTRSFTKGQYCGVGSARMSPTLRFSNLYIAPLYTTLGLQSESQFYEFPVFWGGIPGSGRTMEINGTWTGTEPTALRYRVVNDATGAVIQDWAWASGATISSGGSSGTWTVNAQVPMCDNVTNRKLRVEVGSYGDADARTMTPKGFAVGYLISTWGQSNASGWAGGGATSYTPTANSYGWDGTNGWDGGNTNSTQVKTRKLGDILAPLLGIPVGTFAYGMPARHIYELDGRDGVVSAGWPNYADSGNVSDVEFLDNFEAFLQDHRVQGYGYIQHIIWIQGEAETADTSMSEAQYRDYFTTMMNNIRGAAGVADAQFQVCGLGSYTGPGADVGENGNLISRVRGWLSRMPTLSSDVHYAANFFDLTTGDGTHYDGDGVVEGARRVGYSIAKYLGLTTISGRGPYVTSAARSGSTITLTLDLNGSTGLAAQTGLTYYAVNSASDFTGTSYSVSSADVSGNTIVLTLSSTPPGPVYVRSHWKADLQTGAVYAKGNYASGIQIPVEPIYTAMLSN